MYISEGVRSVVWWFTCKVNTKQCPFPSQAIHKVVGRLLHHFFVAWSAILRVTALLSVFFCFTFCIPWLKFGKLSSFNMDLLVTPKKLATMVVVPLEVETICSSSKLFHKFKKRKKKLWNRKFCTVFASFFFWSHHA